MKQAIAGVIDDYASKWSFENLGRVAVCPDTSGSMRNVIDNKREIVDKHGTRKTVNHGAHVPIHVASMFAGVLCSSISSSLLFAWDERLHTAEDIFIRNSLEEERVVYFDIDDLLSEEEYVPIENWRKASTIMDRISKGNGRQSNMELPVKYLLDNDIEVDTFILITDTEEWGEGWLDYWRQYRELHDSRAYLIRVDMYPTRPFPASVTTELDITQIFGFGDNVFKILQLE